MTMTKEQMLKKRIQDTLAVSNLDPFADDAKLISWHEAAHLLIANDILHLDVKFGYHEDGTPGVMPKNGDRFTFASRADFDSYACYYLAGYAAEALVTKTNIERFVKRLMATCQQAEAFGIPSKCDDMLTYKLYRQVGCTPYSITCRFADAFNKVVKHLKNNWDRYMTAVAEAKKQFEA